MDDSLDGERKSGNFVLPVRHGSTLAKEFSAAARIMQSSSKELSTLVVDRVKKKCKQTDAAAAAAAAA